MTAFSSYTTAAPTDLLEAIQERASSGLEANGVISIFRQRSPEQKQDLFLRSL
jgi:hypothetical protein